MGFKGISVTPAVLEDGGRKVWSICLISIVYMHPVFLHVNQNFLFHG